MKIKFIEARIDKHNGKYYEKDSIHEFEEARAKEIVSKGCAVLVKEESKSTTETKPKKSNKAK